MYLFIDFDPSRSHLKKPLLSSQIPLIVFSFHYVQNQSSQTSHYSLYFTSQSSHPLKETAALFLVSVIHGIIHGDFSSAQIYEHTSCYEGWLLSRIIAFNQKLLMDLWTLEQFQHVLSTTQKTWSWSVHQFVMHWNTDCKRTALRLFFSFDTSFSVKITFDILPLSQ